jgi:serine/threonine protein kinase/tetratricopeptide (TPR) repeat protein
MTKLFEQIAKGVEGRYEIVRELGRGGMATVFLARDLRHDRLVAIKVLRSSLAESDASDAFLTEIRITARLQHPNILTVLDSGEVNGYCYYVTPYMEGESLRQRLILEKQLPVEVAVHIARQVASALDRAHRHGVIHRDIKPENVLLSEGTHAVVADFGIARAIDAAGVSGLSSGANGTMAYMSPEQVMDSPDVDGRCDVYGLGCMLFEMLAGRTPFVGISPQELADQHLNTPPPSITSLRPLVSPELAATLDRCLAKTPADRFSTAADLAAALATAGTTPTPTPPAGYSVLVSRTDPAPWQLASFGTGPLPQVSNRVARVRRWAPFAAVVLLGVVATGMYAVWNATRSTQPSHGASLAVLPFDNLGGGDEAQYFADGITEEISSQLQSLRGLKLISRTSALALKGTALTIPEIADSLRVSHVLEGTVRRSESKIRVSAKLIEARSDTPLWDRTFERELKDVFSLQDEIAREVKRMLSSAVAGLGSMADAPRPNSSGAYDEYLRGKFLLQKGTQEGVQSAMAAFRRAIALDPAYAPAYAALAEAYSELTTVSLPGVFDPYRLIALEQLLAEKAIQLDSGLAEAYAIRGGSRAIALGNADSTFADFVRAMQLRPNAVSIHAGLAFAMATAKNYVEAFKCADIAVDLDPFSPGVRVLYSGVASAAGRWDLVLKQSQSARELGGRLLIPHAYEAAALLYSGRAKECLQLDLGLWTPVRASCLSALHRDDEARALLAAAEKQADQGGLHWVNTMAISIGYAGLGDAAQWSKWFKRGVEVSPEVYFSLILDSALHDLIRSDPLFETTLTHARDTIRKRFAEEHAKLTVADALR